MKGALTWPKRCGACGGIRIAPTDFSANRANPDGLDRLCKRCRKGWNDRQAPYRQARRRMFRAARRVLLEGSRM